MTLRKRNGRPTPYHFFLHSFEIYKKKFGIWYYKQNKSARSQQNSDAVVTVGEVFGDSRD